MAPTVTAEPGIAFSLILAGLAGDETRERLTIGDIVDAMGDRAFGPLLVVFAMPSILPSPPGTAGVMSIPLIFLTVQMILGKQPWLPGFLARRSISRLNFARFSGHATAFLSRVSRFLRPRLGLFLQPLPERLIGGFCLLLALVLLLPIPFANSTPAFAICLFGLGLLERDGVWILSGMVATVGAVLLALWLGTTLFQAALAFAGHYFG